jgi:DNA-binding CsgD family transcriptional regulator/tetratricopeptide (TPR) repeat protein
MIYGKEPAVPSPSETRREATGPAAARSACGSDGAGTLILAGVPVVAPRFTGRKAELAGLAGALALPGAVVLVEGELGIGKSRLVSEYLATEAGRAARPVVACCPPYQQPQTLGPVADALRPAAGDVPSLGLSGLAGALRPLFPEWANVLPDPPEPAEDATGARSRLFRALAELLCRVGSGLLVVEDAHWADVATLEFLLFLASRPPERGPRLLVTVRPEDVPAGSLLPRLARLATGSRGLRLTLGPLSRTGTAALVGSMLGEQVTEGFTAFLHEQAGGVPLAVEESVRLLASRADLTRRDGRWVRRRLARIMVPPTIRDSVQERSARLTQDAQEVLSAAAVLAEPASDDLIAVVAGLGVGRARFGLSEALGCALLAEDERGLVSFRHALGCRAVYEAIPGPARRLLHQRAGEGLVQRGAPVATLARHFREAGDTQRWLQHAEQAADRALAVGDQATSATLLAGLVTGTELMPGEAVRLMDKIVLLALPDESLLAALAAALRGALGTSGLAPEAEAGLRFQLGRLLSTMKQADASRIELERAVTGLPAGSLQAVRAMMLLGSPKGSNCPASEHLRWLRRAEASAASAEDVPPLERLRLAIDRVGALLLLGEEDGWQQAAAIPWEPRTPGESLQVTRAHANIGEAALLWGRYAEARRSLEHAAELADRYEHVYLQGAAAAALAHLDWLTGAWQDLAERAASLADDEELQALAWLQGVLIGGLLSASVGNHDRAASLLERFIAEARQRGDVQYLMEPCVALARMHLAASDVAEALRVTEEPTAVAVRKGTWLLAADLVPARVAALVGAGRADDAASLAEAAARSLHGCDAPAPKAALALCRAILAEADREYAQAGALFAQVAAAWQALPRPYDALLAREGQARCLLAAGQQDAGLALLSDLLRDLSRLGARGDAARVARTLGEHGGDTRHVWRGGTRGYGERLSPRELEVARLVAAGRTNREIGQLLCRSPKTVATQLNSAMRKLGVSSRTVVASALAEADLAVTVRPAGVWH